MQLGSFAEMISAMELLTHLSAFALPARESLCYHSSMEAQNTPNRVSADPAVSKETPHRIPSSGDLEVSTYLEIAQGVDRPQEPSAHPEPVDSGTGSTESKD